MLKSILAAGALISMVGLANPAQATVYDLAAGFSATNSAPWAYGYIPPSNPGGVFFPTYTAASVGQPVESWSDASLPQTATYGTPSVTHNTSASEWSCCNSVVLLGGQAAFHPGQNGEIASYRFTAPTSGRYGLSSFFSGRDYAGPTDTFVSITLNGLSSQIFGAVIDGYAGDSIRSAFGPSPTASFNTILNLTAGELVFFNVGFDPNGTRGSGPFYYDTTGISATLTSGVPEPSTWAMMLVGFAGLALWTRLTARRRAATVV